MYMCFVVEGLEFKPTTYLSGPEKLLEMYMLSLCDDFVEHLQEFLIT